MEILELISKNTPHIYLKGIYYLNKYNELKDQYFIYKAKNDNNEIIKINSIVTLNSKIYMVHKIEKIKDYILTTLHSLNDDQVITVLINNIKLKK